MVLYLSRSIVQSMTFYFCYRQILDVISAVKSEPIENLGPQIYQNTIDVFFK